MARVRVSRGPAGGGGGVGRERRLESVGRRIRHRKASSTRWYTFPVTDAARAAIAAQRVLIVEDDEAARLGLTELVRTWGFTVEAAADGEQALAAVTSFRPTLVVSDLVMPRMDGLQLLAALGDDLAHIYFVLLTAQGTVETAVDALKHGAEDYLTKPVDPQRLRHLLERLSELSAARRENTDLRRRLREEGRFGRMVGASRAMREGLQRDRAGGADHRVGADHRRDGHRQGAGGADAAPAEPARCRRPTWRSTARPFPRRCSRASSSATRRARSPARYERRAGCFELADRGTLFLDEIAEMMPATQVKLLRVLEERRFRRLGGRDEQDVDVRVIAATNVDPVARGAQRQAARGPLLPAQRLHHRTCRRCASAARTCRCWSSPSSTSSTSATSKRGQGGRSRGDAPARGLRLAGQRARAAQRDRAGRRSWPRATSSRPGTCRRSPPTGAPAPPAPRRRGHAHARA